MDKTLPPPARDRQHQWYIRRTRMLRLGPPRRSRVGTGSLKYDRGNREDRGNGRRLLASFKTSRPIRIEMYGWPARRRRLVEAFFFFFCFFIYARTSTCRSQRVIRRNGTFACPSTCPSMPMLYNLRGDVPYIIASLDTRGCFLCRGYVLAGKNA